MGKDASENSTDVYDVPHSYSVKVVKKRLPTTAKMVDEALCELHSRKGVTLQGITTFITGKYVIHMNIRRKSLIKKRLNELRESGEIVNKTGNGFNGHLILKDKKQFLKNQNDSENNKSKRRSSARETSDAITPERKTSTRIEEQLSSTSSKSSPLEKTPPRKRSSVFDTPPTVALSEIFAANSDSGDVISCMQDTPVRTLRAKKKRRLDDSFKEIC